MRRGTEGRDLRNVGRRGLKANLETKIEEYPKTTKHKTTKQTVEMSWYIFNSIF